MFHLADDVAIVG